MRILKQLITSASVLGVAVLIDAGAVSAQARPISTERPGSILIFPKVINTSSADTVIQITNTTNSTVFAHCYYINGATVNGRPLWQIVDFDLILTRQQPTHWLVSSGRSINPTDSNAGLDPGAIPPAGANFTGSLVCVQVDTTSGDPIAGDALKGEATIAELPSPNDLGGVSKYNAYAIDGINPDAAPSTANQLRLNNVEYTACPAGLHFNFIAQDATDDILTALAGSGAVTTSLTIVPCDMDFENLIPGRSALFFEVTNEFEDRISVGPLSIDCWRSLNLDDTDLGGSNGPLTVGGLGSTHGYARITNTGGNGVLAVANALFVAPTANPTATAAYNVHMLGNNSDDNLSSPGAVIRISDH